MRPLRTYANVAVVDIPDKKVICNITFSDAPRPLTMNHDGSLIYVNVNNLDGFEIGDTKTCKMIKARRTAGRDVEGQMEPNPNGHTFGHGLPSHGMPALTPDESEIWVTRTAPMMPWQIWDNPGDGRNPDLQIHAKTVKVQEEKMSAARPGSR